MPMGHIRLGLVTAFAVIFGIVQIICACMPSAQKSDFAATSTQAVHQMSHMGADDMAVHAGHEMTAQNTSTHDHGEHEHQADCSHCDDAVVLIASVESSPKIFIAHAVYKTAFLSQTPGTRAGLAATNLSALRWLEPPRRISNPDPVTLHTRSLI